MKWLTNKYLIAVIFLLTIGIWMIPAFNKQQPKVDPIKHNFTLPTFQVLVKTVNLKEIQPQINLSGLVKSENNLIVRSQSSGKVKKNYIHKGQWVKKNTPLIELDEQEFKTALDQAKANFQTKKITFKTTQKLFEKGLSSKVKLLETETNLKNATNTLNKAELNFGYRIIKSDIAGVVNKIYVEIGDFVNIGTNLVEILDLTNLKVRAELLPIELAEIKKTNLKLSDFKVLIENPIDKKQSPIKASLSFISKKANPKTRSYPIEISINDSKEIFSLEQWVKINIFLPKTLAYPISRSLMFIDSSGSFAVDIVNNQNKVETIQVKIIKDDGNKVWVIGLANNQKIITRGAGFVNSGNKVSIMQNNSIN